MSLNVSLFRIDGSLRRLDSAGISVEQRLEDILEQDITIASPDWMVIGRQVFTGTGGRADLLCLDPAGDVVVIELKRDRTPRDVVTQLLEYGWWVRSLKPTDLAAMYSDYVSRKRKNEVPPSLDQAFKDRFGSPLPEEWEPEHQLVLVSAELDPTTERIIAYLAEEFDANINALFFQVFSDGERQYLARVWLREPEQSESTESTPIARVRAASGPKVDWNGETYANFGHHLSRRWEDAMKYGYISAGGGRWYVQTLKVLAPGDRVWVNTPRNGFVAVGEVLEGAKPYTAFAVQLNGKDVPITQAPMVGVIGPSIQGEDPDGVEHYVRMRWIKAFPIEQAVREKGFFGNQNTVTRPRDPKWAFTVGRLKQLWNIAD